MTTTTKTLDEIMHILEKHRGSAKGYPVALAVLAMRIDLILRGVV